MSKELVNNVAKLFSVLKDGWGLFDMKEMTKQVIVFILTKPIANSSDKASQVILLMADCMVWYQRPAEPTRRIEANLTHKLDSV
jgi:predicted glutamine amidotransferase